MKFVDLGLSKPLLAAVADEGYEIATPIQAQTIPHTLAGRDVLGCAQTGTGKTAAFALPILNRLSAERRPKGRHLPRTLVLAPTRELAHQIAESFQTYGQNVDIYGTVIYGGVGQGKQVQALRRGVDVVVATPGRLLDLINQGHCDLSAVGYLVLDEADRMLDMGFMPDIKRIISHLPRHKQTMLFSATMPREIRQLADALLHEPARVTVAPESPAVERIEQAVYHVDKPNKSALLSHLLSTLSISRAIVFTRTKHGADRVARQLKRAGTNADAIHGDKGQGARQRAMDHFREGKVHVLVATDIAARGIDVDGISHVFNYDMCRDAESHIHRIGRTARAGAGGTAISFCDREEMPYLRAIERLIRMKIDVAGEQPAYAQLKRAERLVHPMDRGSGQSRQRSRSRQDGRADGARPSRDGHSGNGKKNVPNRGQSKNRNKSGKRRSGGPAAGAKARRPAKRGTGCN
ncbi:MAG: DEAD/DEAH box helicase [Phycisphaerae bacterium]|nr:DEAD/DEAH box helicase [Phycisphaerae bacterium]